MSRSKIIRQSMLTVTALAAVAQLGAVMPSSNNVFLNVGNYGGPRFDIQADGTYHVNFKTATSGLNALHVATTASDIVGTDHFTYATDGTLYVTSSDAKGYFDSILLMVSINSATLPADFLLTITSSGYRVTVDASEIITTSTYHPNAMSEIFDASDFVYGPQTWKPTGTVLYPLWIGEDTSNAANECLIMLIDLYVGVNGQSAAWPGLVDNGNVRVDYHFENLPGLAAFNAYGFRILGGDVQWANRTSGTGASSFTVLGVNELLSDVYDGYAVSRRSVDGDDLIYMALHAGTSPVDPDWDNRCDLVDNDLIDDADAAVMLADFGKTY